MKKQISLVTFGLALVALAGAMPAHAEEIIVNVSGNGSGGDNTVTVTSQSQTTVTQSNEANIENNVDSNTNTGNNSTSNNTGDAAVSTGQANTTTTVNNDGINSNSATVPTSTTGSTTSIVGNGSNSTNNVSVNGSQTTTIGQTNTAHITNNIIIHANTGNNNADFNSGNATIKTGNIFANTTINNKNINSNVAKVPTNCSECTITNENKIKISGNGAGSINNLDFALSDSTVFLNSNVADILNNVFHDLNTGNNSADFNNGSAFIQTGGIVSNVTVNNENINSNSAEKDCNCQTQPGGGEQPETPPTNNGGGNNNNGGNIGGSGGNGGSSGNSNNSTGEVLGAMTGSVLPATGNFFLLWATLASLIMFFAGWYLRFRSGCAPGLVA